MLAEQVSELIAHAVRAVMRDPSLLAPVLVVAAVLLPLTAPAGFSGAQRDPKRMFTAEERRRSFELAGWRCEHKHPLWSRCTNTPTQGDHIFPWSKGGWTRMSNLQALCAFHNNRKSGSVPTRLYVMRLELRRRSYYPEGAERRVEWRPGAAR